MTPDMQQLLLRRPSTQEIWQLARKEGAYSLFEDGVLKVKSGITTLPELLRVTHPPQQK
jgi:type II secretory ATPase GspE/PulE/Tfp pilus assembly ATPase PilB-like protein